MLIVGLIGGEVVLYLYMVVVSFCWQGEGFWDEEKPLMEVVELQAYGSLGVR